MISGNKMTEDLRQIDVLELLPQRPPFVMIDHLVHFDRILTQSELTVRRDNVFFDEGRLTASGLVENIAQTCAARMGYINMMSAQPVMLGFIGAVRNLQVHRTPVEGEVLTTSITVKEEVFQMTLVDANVMVGDEILVECEMKIALSNIASNS
ncbi:MAG: pseudouridylate synthase [Bacteroidales bacterium]|nr:pseudouridylate synthase [Bacteroidales bacterium]